MDTQGKWGLAINKEELDLPLCREMIAQPTLYFLK